ncbi:MAG: cytochrome c oxidase assembly protein, partial [Solirubrobacterales bacterium]|nr:cytochrome c oxidase assembly protein [Solirubrobacterales bacterium]
GLVLIVIAVASPIGSIAEDLFSVHMVEHLMLGDIATLLIVLGVTAPLLAPVLQLPGFDRLRIFINPAVAFVLWAINLYLWHLPLFHEAAVRDELIHVVQHATFVFFGINIWMALLGPLPKPAWFGTSAQFAYIIAVRLTGAVLGNVLIFGDVFYRVYDPGLADWNVGAASDQAMAGGIMMLEGSVLTICLLAWLFLKTAKQTDERQELVEFARGKGVELTDARAARAIAAGRGDELRERIVADSFS